MSFWQCGGPVRTSAPDRLDIPGSDCEGRFRVMNRHPGSMIARGSTAVVSGGAPHVGKWH
jgi:hypothetical protein